jgi:hypothetical protein
MQIIFGVLLVRPKDGENDHYKNRDNKALHSIVCDYEGHWPSLVVIGESMAKYIDSPVNIKIKEDSNTTTQFEDF